MGPELTALLLFQPPVSPPTFPHLVKALPGAVPGTIGTILYAVLVVIGQMVLVIFGSPLPVATNKPLSPSIYLVATVV
jgi:hypothetical protein